MKSWFALPVMGLLFLLTQLCACATTEESVKIRVLRRTPLIQAAEAGNLAEVEAQIARGADINARDRNGMTALHVAARYDKVAVVEALLKRGADVHARDNSGIPPLWYASANKHSAVTGLLLQYGARPEDIVLSHLPTIDTQTTALHVAAGHGDKKVMEALLNKGEKVNVRSSDGYTPLIGAARAGNLEIVRLLLERGVDIDATDRGGNNALMVTTHIDIVNLLVDKGAAIDKKNLSGASALWLAVDKGDAVIVKLLLERGADVNSKNHQQETPLMAAAKRGDVIIMPILFQYGAKVNEKNKKGWSPLIAAAYHGNAQIVRLLLEKEANVNDENNDGKTALGIASERLNYNIVDLVVDKMSHKEFRGTVEKMDYLSIVGMNMAVVKLWFKENPDIKFEIMADKAARFGLCKIKESGIINTVAVELNPGFKGKKINIVCAKENNKLYRVVRIQ